MSSASEDRQKWALLIGINEYPKFAPRGQLTGCINDVEVMRQVLMNSFQFPENHVEVLTDAQASREGILAAMGRWSSGWRRMTSWSSTTAATARR